MLRVSCDRCGVDITNIQGLNSSGYNNLFKENTNPFTLTEMNTGANSHLCHTCGMRAKEPFTKQEAIESLLKYLNNPNNRTN